MREQENCVTLWEQTASISGSKTENRKKAKATLLTKYFFSGAAFQFVLLLITSDIVDLKENFY